MNVAAATEISMEPRFHQSRTAFLHDRKTTEDQEGEEEEAATAGRAADEEISVDANSSRFIRTGRHFRIQRRAEELMN